MRWQKRAQGECPLLEAGRVRGGWVCYLRVGGRGGVSRMGGTLREEHGVTGIDGVEISGQDGPRYEEILTDEALRLIATLHRELAPRRAELLARRHERQRALAEGGTLDFLPETRGIREDKAWRVAEPAP